MSTVKRVGLATVCLLPIGVASGASGEMTP
jgi:hypothetical protein